MEELRKVEKTKYFYFRNK